MKIGTIKVDTVVIAMTPAEAEKLQAVIRGAESRARRSAARAVWSDAYQAKREEEALDTFGQLLLAARAGNWPADLVTKVENSFGAALKNYAA